MAKQANKPPAKKQSSTQKGGGSGGINKGSRGKKKQPSFTDKQLGIEPLNTVAQPQSILRRGKKGKVFVEDNDRLLGILAEVNDKQEGQIRTKLQRVQDREAVRAAKLQEFELKEKRKQDAIESRKKELKGGSGSGLAVKSGSGTVGSGSDRKGAARKLKT